MGEPRTYRKIDDIIIALHDHRFKPLKETEQDNVDKILTDFLIDFFKNFKKNYHPKYPDTDNIGAYRSVLLLRAAMVLDKSDEEWVKAYRNRFNDLWGVDLRTGIYFTGSNPYDLLTSHNLRQIMEEAMPEWPVDYSILDGKNAVLKIYFQEFLCEVYNATDMYQTILDSAARVMGGTFGKTELQTSNGLCHITFTFSRGSESITFVTDEGDEFGLGAGIQKQHTDLITALTMIKDVTENYDPKNFVDLP